MKNLLPAFLLFCLPAFGLTAQTSYSINSTFSTILNCDYITEGIFACWWDKEFDYEDEAEGLLSTLVDCQDDCMNIYNMALPPNPVAGYYYNVYIHNGNDLFPDGWAMGQGTDTNGFPFLTIPIGYAHENSAGAQHEGFHIFQYSANSPGFAYSGDSQWYIEATANWYAALKHPDSKNEYVTASAVTYNPQTPMWYTYNNREPNDEGNWQRYCHQYGMNILINYLTDVRDISPEIIVGGFFAETNDLPQEYLYKNIGPDTFSELYADWAAHNVGGFEHFTPGVEARALVEIRNYGDMADTHPIVETYENGGTGGEWYEPGIDYVTRAWAYNVYKIENSQDGYYNFKLDGDSLGSNRALAGFRGRVVIKNGSTIRYENVEMSSLTDGELTIQADISDEEIFFIVISTPVSFRGNHKFPYKVMIDWNATASVWDKPSSTSLGENFPNPFHQDTEINYQLALASEVVFVITDNTGRKVMEISKGHMPAGKHNIRINRDKLEAGIYFYTMRAGEFVQTKGMVVQ